MKITKIFSYLLFLAVMVMIVSGCRMSKKELANLEPEMVLPEDSYIVFGIDYTDDVQVKNFKKLKKKFPETGLMEKIIEEYDSSVDDKFKYKRNIKPIFDDDWKVIIGMKWDEGFTFAEEPDVEDMEFYIAGKFSESDKVEDLLDDMLEEENDKEDIGKERIEKNVIHWTIEENDFYGARYGDVFFITNTLEDRDSAVERLENEGGFYASSNYRTGIEGRGDGYLWYAYVNGEVYWPIFDEIYEEIGIDSSLIDPMKAINDVYMTFVAEEDGFRGIGYSTLSKDKVAVEKAFPNPDYKVDLVNKVPGEGVVLYFEESSLMYITEAFWMGLMSEVQNSMSLKMNYSPYSYVADFAGISEKEVEELFDSPVAFAISDLDNIFPSMSLYLQLDEKKADSARKLLIALNTFFDNMIKKIDTDMEASGEPVGVLKKEVIPIDGGNIYKLYTDLSVVPEEDLERVSTEVPGFDFTKEKNEFYYGLMEGNVLVFAMYPDFLEVYGKDVLVDDPDYQEAVDYLGRDYGFGVVYFRPDFLMNIVDYYVQTFGAFFMSEEDKETYELVKDFVSTFKYMISSGVMVGDGMTSNFFVKVEEVEKVDE